MKLPLVVRVDELSTERARVYWVTEGANSQPDRIGSRCLGHANRPGFDLESAVFIPFFEDGALDVDSAMSRM